MLKRVERSWDEFDCFQFTWKRWSYSRLNALWPFNICLYTRMRGWHNVTAYSASREPFERLVA